MIRAIAVSFRTAGGRAPGGQRLSALSLAGLVAASAACAATAQPAEYIPLPAGRLSSILASDANTAAVAVKPYSMRSTPVTNAEFQQFVIDHPAWQRGRVARTFSDGGYLRNWRTPVLPGDAAFAREPVTNVSWFAAAAFCEDEGGRLPSWAEWEYSAASDATQPDARKDPAWLARILGWYARPASSSIPAVGGPPNFYGIRDMHGLVWEWVDDFSALLVNPDSRSAEDADRLQFCGAGAINLRDRENYAVLMRIALLSSLKASDSTSSLGFRCVRPLP